MSKEKGKKDRMGLPLIFEVISNCCPKNGAMTSFMTTSGGSIMDNPLARQLECWPKLIEQVEVEVYVFHDVSYFVQPHWSNHDNRRTNRMPLGI